jgi:signal transduction histidine kinase
MRRILYIEDDPASRLLVRKLLTPAGFEVVDATDGIDGIKKAQRGSFDLILVDIAIPGLDGYEVTLRLRSLPSLKDVPIIAVTAEGSRNTSLSVGCTGFMQKPINARTFVDVVESYLGGKREGLNAEESGEHLRQQSQRIVGHLEQKVAELSQANERLIELDQARKEFYRNISHELSTPMTPIVGYAKLLLDEELGTLTPAQQKALRSLSQCVDRLRGLIDNLLDVTGLETGKLKFHSSPLDLLQVLREAEQETLELRRKKSQTLIEDIPGAAAFPLRGDGPRLGRALSQLLENASKFSPSGGRIGLLVQPFGYGVEIIVADEGAGIAEPYRERIFEPFFQIDGTPTRAQGGTGVGLALVRGVARGHGGDISFSPNPITIGGVEFKGAVFRLELPGPDATSRPPAAP